MRASSGPSPTLPEAGAPPAQPAPELQTRGVTALEGRALAPRLRAWGQSLPLALEPASAAGAHPPAESQPRCSILSPGPFLHLIRAAAPAPQRLPHGRRSLQPPRAPHASRQLVPPPRGLSPLQKPPPCPARCPLGLAPLPAPLLCHQEQFSGRERARRPGAGQGCSAPGRWYSFIVQVLTGLRTGQSWFFWLSPAPQRERWVGFFGLFVFSLCCVSSQPGQVLPLPLGPPAASLPSWGPGSTLFKPRVFCLWVCILVALSDFCFIISSNRLWCQKH